MIKELMILSMILLAGCSGIKPISIDSKPITIQIDTPANPAMVRMEPVTFKIITKDNLDAFVQQITKDQGVSNPVFIAITIKDYENLSLNLADLKRYIIDQKAIIIYYKKVTSTPNN